MTLSNALLLLCFSSLTTGQVILGDYYWRDWNGTAPNDGIVAGTLSAKPIYIAQAYIKSMGLYVGYIQDKEYDVSINTGLYSEAPLNTSDVIKVLCTSANGTTLNWINANTDTVQSILKFNLPVIGGISNSTYNEIVYVGRYDNGGQMYVGSVHTDMWMYYSNRSIGLDTSEYQLLIRNA